MNEEDSQFRFQRDDRKNSYLWNQILSYLGFISQALELYNLRGYWNCETICSLQKDYNSFFFYYEE